MTIIRNITILLSSLLFAVTIPSFASAFELDDSTVFVQAFKAFQEKDYLLTIEKCDQLSQAFPDSPLRDVTLLLVARASIKSGDNERAARTVASFNEEFPDSSLKTSIETELIALEKRHKSGERLAPNRQLQMAASKVKSDRVARERVAALKLEAERQAKIKAEEERVARLKHEEEMREKARIQNELLAKASIKAEIAVGDSPDPIPVGSYGSFPVEIVNRGKNSEEFILSVTANREYEALLSRSDRTEGVIQRITISAGGKFNGFVVLKMPAHNVDGHRSTVSVAAVSAKYSDVTFKRDFTVSSSAPLIRAVARLVRQKVAPGETLKFKTSVLNAGSIAAKNLTIRLQLPKYVDLLETPDVLFNQESSGVYIFTVEKVDVGQLVEFNLNVKIRDKIPAGTELRGNVEVINESLLRKDQFRGSASVIQ